MKLGNCIHYNGAFINGECEAGVAYEGVKDRTDGPLRLPCCPNDHWGNGPRPIATSCDRFEAATQKDLDADAAKWRAALEAFAKGVCPDCDVPLDKRENEHMLLLVCSKCGNYSRGCKTIGPEGAT